MKKVLWFFISIIMMFSVVGCADSNTNALPIISDSSNSATDTDGDSKEDSSDSSTEIEDDESSETDDDSVEGDDSSSNKTENEPSDESDSWTGFY